MIGSTDARKHPRYQTTDPAILEGDGLPAPCSASLVNIGLGGCRLRCDKPLKVGNLLSFCLVHLPTKINAEVRYSMLDGKEYATGVQFCPTTHAERITLARVVYDINQRFWAW